MMSVTFGISPFQGQTNFDNRSSGWHPTLSNISLSAINFKNKKSVDALIHKKDDCIRQEFEKWSILTYSDNRAVINEKKGAKMNLPLIKEVPKRAQKAKADNQTNLFDELNDWRGQFPFGAARISAARTKSALRG